MTVNDLQLLSWRDLLPILAIIREPVRLLEKDVVGYHREGEVWRRHIPRHTGVKSANGCLF